MMTKKNNQNSFTLEALVVFTVLCVLTTNPAWADGGSYDLSWSTIDAGGGTSSNARYTLIGTIGQPDAGVMSGGDFELVGGFWQGVCLVEFKDFAIFADQWLETGSDLAADLDEDSHVDFVDLKRLADEWLYSCPADWPLK